MTDLFEHNQDLSASPLPHRMRPKNIDEFFFDSLGEVKNLYRVWSQGKHHSFVLYGSPGSGKSSLLEVFYKNFEGQKNKINAVDTTVKKIRELGKEAKNHFELYQQGSLLYVDEVHRLTSSQEDALLPYVESGALLLISATTENPYYVFGRAFLSRLKKVRIEKLSLAQQLELLTKALDVEELNLSENLKKKLCAASFGDNRKLLSDLSYIKDVYSKEGNVDEVAVEHFLEAEKPPASAQVVRVDAMSALIKSMRASDVKAALIYLAYLLKSREEPEVIYRRLMVFVSEDIGSANASAAILINSLWQGYSKTGMPEGEYGLYHAVSYLASSPKSRKVCDFMKWAGESLEGQSEDLMIPDHLKNSGPAGDPSQGNLPLNLIQKP